MNENWKRILSSPAWENRFPGGKVGHVLHCTRGFLATYDGTVLGAFPTLSLAQDRVEAEADAA